MITSVIEMSKTIYGKYIKITANTTRLRLRGVWQKYQMDRGSGTHREGGTTFYKPGQRQLHTEPHTQSDFLSCHIISVARTRRRTEQTSSDKGLWGQITKGVFQESKPTLTNKSSTLMIFGFTKAPIFNAIFVCFLTFMHVYLILAAI